MPHQCVRCNTFYDDGSKEILTGCSSCGGKLFFYIKKEKLERAKEKREQIVLSQEDRKQIEQDVYDLMGEVDQDMPIVLDLESINVLQPGKFELDLIQLFNKDQPLVYKVEEGKYRIDLTNSFRYKYKDSKK